MKEEDRTKHGIPTPKQVRVASPKGLRQQGGFALVAIVTFVIIIGSLATTGVSLTSKSEKLASNAIQRSRSFIAADAAATLAETKIEEMLLDRGYADRNATSGVFSRDGRDAQWWQVDGAANGVQEVDADTVVGVVSPPRFAIEQVGNYVADGGTSISNLDIGSSSYGRITANGREFLLFDVQSHGKGSFDSTQTVIQASAIFSY